MLLVVDDVEQDVPLDWPPFLSDTRRAERWEWRQLDLDDKVVGALDNVTRGGLTFNVYADTRGTGRLTWSGSIADMPSWRQTRVQPIYSAELLDPRDNSWVSVRWPAGVFMCAAPTDQWTETNVEVDVELFDKTLILRRAALTETYSLAAGTSVVSTVRSLLSGYVTGTAPVIEDSTATLRSAMVWEAGTSILRVVNDLLDAINYFAVWADGEGVLRSGPYQAPSSRPLSWSFVTDEQASLYDPDFEHDHDDFETFNRVTFVSRADGDQAALTSTISLDDIDSTHELSFSVTGQWVDYFEEGVEASDQATLDALAERKLVDNLGAVSTYKIKHAAMPLPMNGLVLFTRPDGVTASATVQELSFDIEPGADADFTSRLREVVA